MYPFVVISLSFAIVTGIIMTVLYCYWRSLPDSDYKKRQEKSLIMSAFMTVIYLVLALLLICGAPIHVALLFMTLGVVMIVIPTRT